MPVSSNDAQAVNQVTARPVQVSYTKAPDWVLTLPVPDNALRIYLAVRMFIYEKDPAAFSVRITDAELAELTHRSVDSARRARKAAARWGLLWEVRRWTESSGRGTARTVRELGIQLDPPDSLPGSTNAHLIRKALKVNGGPGIGSADLHTRSDQQVSSDPDVSAGRIGCADLPQSSANLPNPSADLPQGTPGDQQEGDPQEALQEVFQEPTRAPAGAGAGWMAGNEGGGTSFRGGRNVVPGGEEEGRGEPAEDASVPGVDAEIQAFTPAGGRPEAFLRRVRGIAGKVRSRAPGWTPNDRALVAIARRISSGESATALVDGAVEPVDGSAPRGALVTYRLAGSSTESGSQRRNVRRGGDQPRDQRVTALIDGLAESMSKN